ncbi:MAG: tRNA lysidine(34) synthetase TilS [Oscillospiraceae bacterium]|nr:tRNA lysidine(34) synthetase TilS [Oscillospiraceae bacterium]
MSTSNFSETVKNTIKQYDMLRSGDRAVVALSGGADSVSLLFVLKEISEELCFTVGACHVNHGLRGEESDGDMRFCQELCGRLGVELEVLDTDVRSFQKKHESIEETARRVRYDFFARVSEGARLATAHNSNDSTETMLLNLMRGTGLKGLCGIPPVRGNIIRPLLYCTRAEVEEYCAENGLSYVTDKTNLSTDYTRNKVRHILLPEMQKINGSFLDTAERVRRNLCEDSELLESMAAQSLEAAKSGCGYSVDALCTLPRPIRTRAIRTILMQGGIEPSSLRINMTEEILLSGKGKINPCRGKFVTVKKGVIFVEEQEQIYKKHLDRS